MTQLGQIAVGVYERRRTSSCASRSAVASMLTSTGSRLPPGNDTSPAWLLSDAERSVSTTLTMPAASSYRGTSTPACLGDTCRARGQRLLRRYTPHERQGPSSCWCTLLDAVELCHSSHESWAMTRPCAARVRSQIVLTLGNSEGWVAHSLCLRIESTGLRQPICQ
jgi:hypothetical protein